MAKATVDALQRLRRPGGGRADPRPPDLARAAVPGAGAGARRPRPQPSRRRESRRRPSAEADRRALLAEAERAAVPSRRRRRERWPRQLRSAPRRRRGGEVGSRRLAPRSARRSAIAARFARSASARSAARAEHEEGPVLAGMLRKVRHLVRVEEASSMASERAQPLEPEAGAGAQGSQARRPRPGLRQGPLLGPRDQGPEVARRLAQDARRLRGRADADPHAHGQAARLDVEGRDADRAVPHVLAAGQRRGARRASTPAPR